MKVETLLRGTALAMLAAGCTSDFGDSHASTAIDNHVSYRKSVPAEGDFVMHAFFESNKVHTLGYTRAAGGQLAIEEKTTSLRAEDRGALVDLFTSARCESYRADQWNGTPGTPITECPEAQRVCGPVAPGQTPPGACLCMAPPGSVSTLQYEVRFDGVAEAKHGMFTFREPMSETTRDMVTALDAIRLHHFGK